MKGTNRSWRAQTGSTVRYAADRISGKGVIMQVVEAPKLGVGDGEGVYLVRDEDTRTQHTVTGAQIRFSKPTP